MKCYLCGEERCECFPPAREGERCSRCGRWIEADETADETECEDCEERDGR